MTDIKDGANYAPSGQADQVVAPGEFCFATAFLDHGHIYGQTNGLRDADGQRDMRREIAKVKDLNAQQRQREHYRDQGEPNRRMRLGFLK